MCAINLSSVDPRDRFGDVDFVYIDISSVENETGRLNLTNIVKPANAPQRARRVVKNTDVLISTVRPNLKAFAYLDSLPERVLASTGFAVLSARTEFLSPKFLYYIIKTDLAVSQMVSRMGRGSYPSINQEDVSQLQIPLPPLPVQEALVAELDSYQRIIDGARQVVANWRPRIDVDPAWPVVALGEVCEIVRGGSPRPIRDYITDDPNGVNWIKIGDAKQGSKYITETVERITPEGAKKSRLVKPGDFILSNSMSFGRPYILATEGYIHDGWLLLRDLSTDLDRDYLYYILGSDQVLAQFEKAATGGVVNNLNSRLVREVQIPIPPLQQQVSIVAEFEAERRVIESNADLIARYEQKIKARLARVWGK